MPLELDMVVRQIMNRCSKEKGTWEKDQKELEVLEKSLLDSGQHKKEDRREKHEKLNPEMKQNQQNMKAHGVCTRGHKNSGKERNIVSWKG